MRREVKETQTVTETKEVLVSNLAYCNKCGKKYEQVMDKSFGEYCWDSELNKFEIGFGYESRYDEQYWKFDLCDDCLTEIVRGFKIVPDGFMNDDRLLDDEKLQKVFEDWKNTSEWEWLKYHTYDELVEMNGYIKTEFLNECIQKYHPGKDLL